MVGEVKFLNSSPGAAGPKPSPSSSSTASTDRRCPRCIARRGAALCLTELCRKVSGLAEVKDVSPAVLELFQSQQPTVNPLQRGSLEADSKQGAGDSAPSEVCVALGGGSRLRSSLPDYSKMTTSELEVGASVSCCT